MLITKEVSYDPYDFDIPLARRIVDFLVFMKDCWRRRSKTKLDVHNIEVLWSLSWVWCTMKHVQVRNWMSIIVSFLSEFNERHHIFNIENLWYWSYPFKSRFRASEENASIFCVWITWYNEFELHFLCQLKYFSVCVT